MSAYTRQKAKSKYRNHILLERPSQEQSNGTNKTPYGRVIQCRKRKRMNATEWINDGAKPTSTGKDAEDVTTFISNLFGHKCDVCDCLWFLRSLKPTKEKLLPLLNNTFPEELVADFKLCAACKNSLDPDKVPTLSSSNGLVYPPKQHVLPALNPIKCASSINATVIHADTLAARRH
ncbi:uncharacterized protein TNCV_4342781 [Trichonephila clavipes]|nr:uncharacterized protein TNCV_4342781 [Trichonephila clavipes]